jgi:glycosyltransferase 2 family protein
MMAEPDSPEPSEPQPADAQLRAAGLDRAEVMGRLTPGQLTRRVATAAGVVAVIVLAIIELPGLQDVRSRFTHADPGWIVAAVIMEALSIACFVLALQRTFAGWLRPRGAIAVGTTAQGVNAVVPAGGTAGLAFAAVILTDGGFPVTFTVGRLVALFLITSVLTNLVLIVVGGGGATFGLLPAHASLAASVVPAVLALALLVVFTFAVRSPREEGGPPPGRWTARATRRPLEFLREATAVSGELLRDRDPWLAVGALGYVVCDLIALAAALAALGWGGLGLGTVVLGYTLGQIGSVIPLPGTTEGGLAGALALYGAPLTLAIPAVLVYRTVAIAVPLLMAAVGAAQLRRGLEVSDVPDATWPASAPPRLTN